MNGLKFANEKLGWSTYHEKRKQDQFWQEEILNDRTTNHSRVYLMGRRMGATELAVIKAIDIAYNKENVSLLVPFENMKEEMMERMTKILESSDIKFTLVKDCLTIVNRFKIDFHIPSTYSNSRKNKYVVSESINYASADFLKDLTYDIKKGKVLFDLFFSGDKAESTNLFKIEDVRFYHYPGSLLTYYKEQANDLRVAYPDKKQFEREILAIDKT